MSLKAKMHFKINMSQKLNGSNYSIFRPYILPMPKLNHNIYINVFLNLI